MLISRMEGLALVASLLLVSTATSAQNRTNSWDEFQKYYPPRALAAHEEGAVGFDVTLDSKGDVTSCQITRSSGHPLLDEETCQLITLHAKFKPDTGTSVSQTHTSRGVIAWKLPGSTMPLQVGTVVAPSMAPEKIVCKKTLRTGSLASFERTCMTPSQWATQSDQQKADWEDIQGKKGSTSGN